MTRSRIAKRLCGACLLPLLTVSAWGQTVPQGEASAPQVQPDAMVDSLYKEVVARHPFGIPDLNVFGQYLSKTMLHRFDLARACYDGWRRENPDPNLKPPVGLTEYGIFSGGSEETDAQTFHIEKTETGKDGSYRVHVKLTWEDASNKMSWYVAAVVVRENGRPVVDDILYLKGNDRDVEFQLSKLLTRGCKGYS